METDSIVRMKQLIPQLNEASRVYYNEDSEIMSNFEYDKLYDELTGLERSTGVVLAGSPTQTVGYTVLSGLTKVRHETPMLSLDKTKSPEKLRDFLGNQTGLMSWKLDGLTIVLRYSGGQLVQAVTRGNGEIGEDVTHNAKVFKNVPLKISFTGDMVLRGEAVIGYSDFDRINNSLDASERYKNPRNLVSGTVRQLNSEIAAGRGVMLYVFALISAAGYTEDSKAKQFDFLSGMGFDVVGHRIVTYDTIEQTMADFEQHIPENNFASDGLVLTYDSVSYGQSLGITSKFPKDSLAFKWADEMAETTLRDITWNTSRTGLINPVAVFDPVELEGTTVRQASVHNVSVMQNLALGLGDTIKVYKANMIIPQIGENLTRSATAQPPANCPVCGWPTEIIGSKDGKALFCGNPLCNAQIVRGLTHFASRDAMNIEGLSEQSLQKFVDMGFIGNYTDIYGLSQYENEITQMDGFGPKSFGNLMAAIERSKTVPVPNFLYGLGIDHVGLSNAKLICGYYDNDIEKIITAQPDELASIDGVGEVICRSVRQYFDSEKNVALLRKLLPQLHLTKPEPSGQPQRLSGLSFVVTGDLNRYKNRKELQAYIESLGGKVTGSVTSKTAYLINNDSESASAKNKKARELGVRVITEVTFIEMFGQAD